LNILCFGRNTVIPKGIQIPCCAKETVKNIEKNRARKTMKDGIELQKTNLKL